MYDQQPLFWVPPLATHLTLKYSGESDAWFVRVAHSVLDEREELTATIPEVYGPLTQAEVLDVLEANARASMGDWGC